MITSSNSTSILLLVNHNHSQNNKCCKPLPFSPPPSSMAGERLKRQFFEIYWIYFQESSQTKILLIAQSISDISTHLNIVHFTRLFIQLIRVNEIIPYIHRKSKKVYFQKFQLYFYDLRFLDLKIKGYIFSFWWRLLLLATSIVKLKYLKDILFYFPLLLLI